MTTDTLPRQTTAQVVCRKCGATTCPNGAHQCAGHPVTQR